METSAIHAERQVLNQSTGILVTLFRKVHAERFLNTTYETYVLNATTVTSISEVTEPYL